MNGTHALLKTQKTALNVTAHTGIKNVTPNPPHLTTNKPMNTFMEKQTNHFKGGMYRDEDLNFVVRDEILDTLITTIIQNVGEELEERLAEMKQDQNPVVDGVPIETYGYEETHNLALRKAIRIINQVTNRDTTDEAIRKVIE